MSKFIFENTTKVYFGPEQLEHLPEEIRVYGDKVLLVYGGGSIKKNRAAREDYFFVGKGGNHSI